MIDLRPCGRALKYICPSYSAHWLILLTYKFGPEVQRYYLEGSCVWYQQISFMELAQMHERAMWLGFSQSDSHIQHWGIAVAYSDMQDNSLEARPARTHFYCKCCCHLLASIHCYTDIGCWCSWSVASLHCSQDVSHSHRRVSLK